MEVAYALHDDGTLVIADYLAKYVDKRKYKKVIVAKPVDMHSESSLYPGYTGELLYKLYPGAPILTYFDSYPEWKLYQPETYKFRDIYKLRRAGTRGTLAGAVGDLAVSAYHVLAMGTFKDENLIYETPNTPCAFRLMGSDRTIGHTSVLTEPAQYVLNSPISRFSEYSFKLERDIALAMHNLPVLDKCLFFVNGKYEFRQCDVIGVVSGVLGGLTYVAPLREVMPETPAYMTGSSSGTVMLKPLGSVRPYMLVFRFGNNSWSVYIERGWVFEGAVKPGDSGAPVFVPH